MRLLGISIQPADEGSSSAQKLCIPSVKQIEAYITIKTWQQFLPRDALLSAVYAVVVCLSVCLSVCVCVCQTPYCIKTVKRRITQISHTIVPGLYFSDTKVNGEIRTGSPPTGATNAGGVG